MITGDRALAEGKHGAFYNTLEEFHKYWDRIDIICPRAEIPNDPRSIRQRRNYGAGKIEISNQIQNPKSKTLKIFRNVFIHPSPWPLIFQPFWILKKGLEIYKENKFDLMTVHEYPPFYNGIGARLLWEKIKQPYILEIMHIPGHPKAGDLKERIYKNLLHLFIKFDSKKAKAIRVINQKETPQFLINSGVPKEKLIYIPAFYIDLDVFRPMNPHTTTGENLKIKSQSDNRPFGVGVNLEKEYDLIFVGRLAKNKGIHLFIETVRNLYSHLNSRSSGNRENLQYKSLIVGEGPEKENLKFKIPSSISPSAITTGHGKNLKLHNNIVLYGWAKDSKEIAELLNQSRILVMPSFNEGGPRVVLEAMACGVPVLATPVGIVPDIIKDGESGGIISWQPDDIAFKAGELLSNSEKYNRYSQAGIEIAKQFEKNGAIKNYAERLKGFLG